MGRFTDTERRKLDRVKQLCYVGLAPDELLRQVCERLRDAVGVDRYCGMELDPATVLPVAAVHDRGDPEVHRLLVEHALLATPTADPPALHRRGVRAMTCDALLPTHATPRTDPYWRYHLFPLGLRYEAQVLCVAGGRPRAFLTLCREEGRGDFGARDIALLDALAPHVGAGMHAATLRQTGLAHADAETGVLVLDERGALDFANGAGDRWAERHEPRRWLMAVDLLRSLVLRAETNPAECTVPSIMMRDPREQTLYRLRAERRIGQDGRPRTLILVEPARVAHDVEPLLRLGLTRREAQVALAALAGDRVEDIAREASCSAHTVHDHLKSLFEKLGVSSRRELAGFLMGASD